MDGRAGVQPTETNGSVVRDAASAPPVSTSGTADEPVRSPLTIREVVRRARQELDELERLRAEVDELRVRAESAEHMLGSARGPATPIAARPRRLVLGRAHREYAPAVSAPEGPASETRNGHATNGHATNGSTNGHATNGDATNGPATNGHAVNGDAVNGNGATDGQAPTNGRIVASATVSGWAPATMLPRSKRS